MKRVIVTGASGFVGACLTRALLAEGHELHLVVRPGFKPWRLEAIRDQVRLHLADLNDMAALQPVINRIKPDWVFHLATYGAYSYQADMRQALETNFSGTLNLVEACLKTGFEVFINTGSSSEYGFKDHPPSEDEMIEPNSFYAVGKASATLFGRFTAQRLNVAITTLRLYSAYGPYEEPTRLIPALLINGLEGKLPPLVNPAIARDYIYVDDVVRAFITAAQNPERVKGEVFNLGTGIQLSLREVVETVRRQLEITSEPQWGSMENRQWDTSIWVADNSKIRRELGWQPDYSFEKGLRATTDWLRQNPALLDYYRQMLAA
jgi:nucleoside-diphosphate-sugar epimerase